jgi:hypothetical protein
MEKRLRVIVTALALIILLGAAVIATSNRMSPVGSASSLGSQTKDPWPPFVMTYRENDYNWENGQVSTYDVYRYTYTSRSDWKLELVESTRDPRVVGSWTSYDGTSYREAGMIDGAPLPMHVTRPDQYVMATWWLVPVSPERLGMDGKYERVKSEDATRIRLRQDEEFPCSSLSAAWQPRLCLSGQQSYKRSTEKVLTADRGIPVEITESAEGKVTHKISISELTYK